MPNQEIIALQTKHNTLKEYSVMVNSNFNTEPEINKFIDENQEYLKALSSLPDNLRIGVHKHALRLLNNDPKVKRLTELLANGEISLTKFYRLM